MALHFDKGDMFAFDKLAQEPCRNLAPGTHHCTIHESLIEKGFAGCVRFDCLGAGQRTIQDVFSGRSWIEDRTLLPDMITAFRLMRRLHESLEILSLCSDLPLDDTQESLVSDLQHQLSPPNGKWTLDDLVALETNSVFEGFNAQLAGLQSAVARRAALAGPAPQA